MGADVVVNVFPVAELRSDVGHGWESVTAFVKLLGVGSLRALNMPVELGAARRQLEEEDASVLAGLLEFGHKLRTAIDLDRPDGEGGPLDHGSETVGRHRCRG